MRNLGKIVSRMAAAHCRLEAASAVGDGRLDALTGFGGNPGALDARIYVPTDAPSALVVALHGCTQNASVYDHGSGWSKLAERHGFALLFPQQRRANNPNLCFNWYSPNDASRGRGEALSISQMVEYMAAHYRFDRSRIFITGLSAGGAMTSVMLACYPELFAGGAVIAGLPFASAKTLPEALERMRGEGFPSRQQLSARVKAAGEHESDPPTLSVWHGTNDIIVVASNATATVDQWRDLHGVGNTQGRVETLAGHRREIWSDVQGRTLVEKYDIIGMGHGIPLGTHDNQSCGAVGPHMIEAGICSTRQIAQSWRLVTEEANQRMPSHLTVDWHSARSASKTMPPRPAGATNVGAVIEDALRSAGLMR